jgi:prevent-host-death family protein
MSIEPTAQFNIHEAQANLSRLIARVEQGEEIIISRAGKPVAKLVPLTAGREAGEAGERL